MRSLIAVMAAATLAGGAAAQATPFNLSTSFVGSFFANTADATCMFDLEVLNPAGITLFNINHNTVFIAGIEATAELRVVQGAVGSGNSFAGNENNPAFWPADPDRELSYVAPGALDTPAPSVVPGGLFLPQGEHAIAISYPAGDCFYSVFNGTNGTFFNTDLQFDGGSVSPNLFAGGLFGGPGLRVWGGSLDYYQGNVPVASAVTFGAECPSFSDGQFVFEPFTAAGGLLGDLNGMEVIATPNSAIASDGYTISGNAASAFVTPGGGAIPLILGDDALSGPLTVTGAGVRGPDGSVVNMVEVDSNGRILFDTVANTASIGGPSAFDFINDAPSIQIGADYDPSMGGMVFYEDLPGEIRVTWDNVPEFNQAATLFTTQISVDKATGAYSFRFVNYVPIAQGNTGISQGNGFGAALEFVPVTDLSGAITTPVDLGTSSRGVLLEPLTTPIINSNLDMNLSQVPASAIAVSILVGFTNPDFPLDAIGGIGCTLLSSGEATIAGPLGGGMATQFIPNFPALAGNSIVLQAAALAPGVNALNFSLSNGLQANVELQ